MSIFVCGDIHSTFDIDKLDQFRNRTDLNENDYLIICGDTGICGISTVEEAKTREYLRKLPMTILFVDGNHENFKKLNSYPVDEWHGGKVHIIEPGIIHLMRGQIYRIDEKSFFTFGGTYSDDRMWRVPGKSWFEEELPSKEEYAEARRVLEKHNYKVDYIITHTGPHNIITGMNIDCHDATLEQIDFFQQIAEMTDFKEWYFGHFHKDVDIENFHCRIDEVTML